MTPVAANPRVAWRRWLPGLPLAAACLWAQAGGLQVQSGAVLAADAPIGEAVKAECAIEAVVGEQVLQVLRDRFTGVLPATEAQRAADDPFVRLTVLWVVGGAYPGPKSLGLRAEVLLGERVVAAEQFRESSMSGLGALAGGPCTKFADVARGLGEEVSGWLPEVVAAEFLPLRPVAAKRPGARAAARLQHDRPLPAASGYAAIDDLEALPLREQGKQRYRHYLALRPPKAFVISENGSWVMTATDTAAIGKSLDSCVLRGRPCWVYAVDDRVVWQPDLARRIGKPAAAEPERLLAARPAPASPAPVSDEPVAAQAEPRPHRIPVPVPTGFADGRDAAAVPVRSGGSARYQHYLTLPGPKAFVVYADGGWRFQWNNPDAMTELLDLCARQGRPCWLYAVDDQVVWSGDPALRIGSSAQVRGRRAAASATALH